MTATRFYLLTGGTAAITPSIGSGWDGGQAPSLAVRPMSQTPTGVASSDSTGSYTSGAGPTNVATRQHVSDAQVPSNRTISGTLSGVIRCSESNASANAALCVIARVVSSDGLTERGVLYAGPTGSSTNSTTGDPMEEMGTSLSTRIINAVTLTPVAAQTGDYIILELGYRKTESSSSTRSCTFYMNATPSGTDLALTADLTATGRPWFEFSYDIFGAGPTTINAASTPKGVGSSSAASHLSKTATASAKGVGSASATATITSAGTIVAGAVAKGIGSATAPSRLTKFGTSAPKGAGSASADTSIPRSGASTAAGISGASGAASVGSGSPPANDNFANALQIVLVDGQYVSDAVDATFATLEGSEPMPTASDTTLTAWWYYTPTADGLLSLDTFASTGVPDNDTTLAVYTGTTLAGLTEVASNDDADTGAILTSKLDDIAVTASTTYWVQVGAVADTYTALNYVLHAYDPTVVSVGTDTTDGSTGLSFEDGWGDPVVTPAGVTVEARLEPIHVVVPTVPVPTLVDGRPV